MNLSETVTENDLATFAASYGHVDSTRVIRDHETQKSKGYGFIYMLSIEEALKVGRSCSQQFC